MFEILIFP